jgi:hypothetical protein
MSRAASRRQRPLFPTVERYFVATCPECNHVIGGWRVGSPMANKVVTEMVTAGLVVTVKDGGCTITYHESGCTKGDAELAELEKE